jgi:membrane protease YdiL (CAAX protease family)
MFLEGGLLMRNFISKHNVLSPLILTLLLAAMDLFAFPLSLFGRIELRDVNPDYITLILNQIFTFVFGLFLIRYCYPNWPLNFWTDKKTTPKYLLIACITSMICAISFWIGLQPFDNSPSVLKILIEVFGYNLCVAFIEEFYIRGLLLNVMLRSKAKSINAVFFSALIFALGHIPGSLGDPFYIILSKVLWTFGLGLYLGTVYVKTEKLLYAVLIHYVINLCALPICFVKVPFYPNITLAVLVPMYLLLGCYSIVLLKKDLQEVSK